jgi:hypothetical protein
VCIEAELETWPNLNGFCSTAVVRCNVRQWPPMLIERCVPDKASMDTCSTAVINSMITRYLTASGYKEPGLVQRPPPDSNICEGQMKRLLCEPCGQSAASGRGWPSLRVESPGKQGVSLPCRTISQISTAMQELEGRTL